MKSAAEVGGDYYDFHQSDNGALTVEPPASLNERWVGAIVCNHIGVYQ